MLYTVAVFWKGLTRFFSHEYAFLIETIRSALMNNRTEIYDTIIHLNRAPLDQCVRFKDGDIIQMHRLGGPSVLQQEVYSVNKRFHYLIYQTIKSLEGLVFKMYGTEW